MNKFERELKEGAEENERIAIEESIKSLEKARDSSLMAIGLFEHTDSESVFSAIEFMHHMMIRVRHLSIQTMAEMKENDREVDSQKIAATEIIWHIQDSVRSISNVLVSITR